MVRTTNQFVQCMLFDDSLFYPIYFVVPSQAAINHHLCYTDSHLISYRIQGPDGPKEINTFLVYDRDELQQINVSWQEVVSVIFPWDVFVALIHCKEEGFNLVTSVCTSSASLNTVESTASFTFQIVIRTFISKCLESMLC